MVLSIRSWWVLGLEFENLNIMRDLPVLYHVVPALRSAPKNVHKYFVLLLTFLAYTAYHLSRWYTSPPTGVFIFFLVHFSKLISLVKNSHIFLISCSSQETNFYCEELSRLPGLRELNSGHPWWHLHILDQSGKALDTSLSLKTLPYLRLMASRPRRQRPTWACWTPPICSPTPSSCSSVDLLLRGWTCATSWAWGWYSGFKRYYSLDEQ